MTKTFNRILLVIIFCFAASGAFAQDPPGGGDDLPGDPNNPDVPITGIELLLAAGAGYGAKKAYEVYKKRR